MIRRVDSFLFSMFAYFNFVIFRFSSLDKSQVIHIQSTLMEFVKREYVIGEGNGDEPQCQLLFFFPF